MRLDIEISTRQFADFMPIIRLYEQQTGRILNRQIVRGQLANHPCAAAFITGRLIGFIYTRSAAPDLLEIDNIYVAEGFRDSGIGSALLMRIEDEAQQYTAIMLIDSMLYDYRFTKRSARTFYVRNGFVEVWSNANTSVYIKTL